MTNFLSLAWVYWNPNPDAFIIPFLDHPVRWYGIFFAFGFIVGYLIFRHLLLTRLNQEKLPNAHHIATSLTEQLLWFVTIGTVVGARLGHVFFYEWPRYSEDLLRIFKIWEGGLASHGGVIGILVALFFYKTQINKFIKTSYVELIDMLSIPAAFGAFCIRIGNFINQEILGTETTVPWAIIFGNPADRAAIVPRHPVQLYEAFALLFVFIFLFSLWKLYHTTLRPGVISGLLFILIFGSRFFIEFFKEPSSLMINESFLQTGQLLSIPCILFGLFLLFFGNHQRKLIS